MFAAATPILTLVAAAAIYVRAEPNPNNPGPGDVFIQGQTCTIGWDVDPTGVWKTMNIDLMTGDNFNMISLTSVAKAVDGTNQKNTYSFTCPQVQPHSPIYFYQFSSPSTTNKTWTGRFAITDSANNIVAPVQSIQPDGSRIPWGTGALVMASSSSSAAPSASRLSDAPGPVTHPTGSVTGTISAGSPPQSASPSNAMTSNVLQTSTPSTTPSAGSSGAAATFSVSGTVLQTGLALALAAFGFAAMF